MKKLWVLLAVIAAVFTMGTSVWAADFELYGDYGCVDQFYGTVPLGPSLSVSGYSVGATCDFGRIIIGSEYMLRSIDGYIWPGSYGGMTTYDIYAGYKLFDTKKFELYGLLGYASNSFATGIYFGPIGVQYALHAEGIVAGIGAELKLGSFVIDGKLMATVNGSASETASLLGPGGISLGLTHEFDGGLLLIGDLRLKWQITDLFGIYGAIRYIKMDGIDAGVSNQLGQSIWYAVGLSFSF